MKKIEKLSYIIKNSQGEVRNGWWIGLFVILVVATQPIYGLLKSIFESAGANQYSLELIPIALILFVSYVCLKVRRESFNDMGLSVSRRSLSLFILGALLGQL